MPINVAVIGMGRWGPNHLRNFSSLKDCRVTVVADPSEPARKRIAESHPNVRVVSDYREAVTAADVDAVVVATPTFTHFEIVSAAIAAGKHVLCEKPLTNRGEDAWKLVRAAEARGVHLMTGHVFLFNPGIEFLGKSIRERTVGQVYYLNAIRTNLGPFRSDVNAGWDLASHDIYIFNHLLGERPSHVSAVGASWLRKPVEDICFITMRYPDGIVGHVHVSWLDPKKVRQLTIVGEKKMITWDEFGVPGPVTIYDREVVRDPIYNSFGEFQLLTREGDVAMPRIPPAEPLAQQAREFAGLVSGKIAKLERGHAKQAAEVVDVLEAMSRSLANGGASEPVVYGG